MPEKHEEQQRDAHRAHQLKRTSRNMHENVEADEDEPCVCCAEPRWQALAEEMERERERDEKQPDHERDA